MNVRHALQVGVLVAGSAVATPMVQSEEAASHSSEVVCPVRAEVIALQKEGSLYGRGWPASREVIVAVARGRAVMGEVHLAEGDLFVDPKPDPSGWRIGGEGTVVLVSVLGAPSDGSMPKPNPRVIRATEGSHLRWAKGAMGATLMARADVSPWAYVGWLDGTQPVPLHAHSSSCEVIVAVEATGTVRLAGANGRLAPGGVFSISPGAPHAWQPDPGTGLRALQIYAPPGPEQRFVERAARGD
jgi:hypothetical protein